MKGPPMGRAQELTDSLAALRGAPEPCPELDGFTLNNSYNILGQFKSAIHCDGLEGYLTPGATNEEVINDVLDRLMDHGAASICHVVRSRYTWR